ncbi:MAG: Spy/CpxP family protein refolding chaperone [Polyangiales bacterium]
MKAFRSTISNWMMIPLFGVFASLGVAACSGQAATDGNASTNNAVTTVAQSDKPAHGPGMGMHGPASLLFAALHEPINLTDAQRSTIQAAVDTLKPKAPPADSGHKAALVAAVRAGKIDTTALAIKPEAIDHSAHTAAVAKALTTLHSTLTKDQRVALVAAVQKRASEHKFEGKDGQKHQGFGPMKMLDSLNLTPEQETAIKKELEANKPAPPTDAERAAMKTQHEAFRKEMDARLQTFAADNFDANAFVAPPANAPKMGPAMHGDRFLNDLAVIVPILTPAQRDMLAAKLEKGPPAPPAAQ